MDEVLCDFCLIYHFSNKTAQLEVFNSEKESDKFYSICTICKKCAKNYCNFCKFYDQNEKYISSENKKFRACFFCARKILFQNLKE